MINLGGVTTGELIMFLIPWPLLFLFVRMIKSSKQKPLPPGPFPWPIVGNIFQIGGRSAHVRLAEMANVHGPLMSLRLGHRVLVVGSTPAAASELLKTHDHSLSGRDVTRSFQNRKSTLYKKSLAFTNDSGDEWRKIRNIYSTNIFSNKAMESRAEMRETKVMEMVKWIASTGGENISIKDAMLVTTTNIIGNKTLSMDLVDFEGNGIGAGLKETVKKLADLRVQPQLADLYEVFGYWDLQGSNNKVMQIIEQEFGGIWEEIVDRKINGSHISPDQQDFIDFVIERGYTRQQINALMEELISAGTDSMGNTTEWFIAELLKDQRVLQKVRDEVRKTIDGNVVRESDLTRLPFLEACFKEILRLHPPAPLLLPHRAVETCEVMGYTVPKDSKILVNIWAIGRDPKFWDDPLSFKPGRFMESKMGYKSKDFEYFPFSAGRRTCPGEPLASKAIRVAVASLILNFDWFLVNNMNPEDINMDEVLDLPMYKKEPLHVTFKSVSR